MTVSPGRWIHRKVALEKKIYSQAELDRAPLEHYGQSWEFSQATQPDADYLWVPHACRYNLYSFEDFRACTRHNQYNFLIIGSSIERLYWHDLSQFAGINYTLSKEKGFATNGNNETRISFYYYWQLIKNSCAMQAEDERALEQLVARNGTANTVIVMSIGIAEVHYCPRSAVVHNMAILQRVLPRHKGPVVWISPPAVIDWRISENTRRFQTQNHRWLVSSKRMTQFYEDWKAATKSLPSSFGLIDSFQMIASRWDATLDGIHPYHPTSFHGGPTSKWAMMLLLNILCEEPP